MMLRGKAKEHPRFEGKSQLDLVSEMRLVYEIPLYPGYLCGPLAAWFLSISDPILDSHFKNICLQQLRLKIWALRTNREILGFYWEGNCTLHEQVTMKGKWWKSWYYPIKYEADVKQHTSTSFI